MLKNFPAINFNFIYSLAKRTRIYKNRLLAYAERKDAELKDLKEKKAVEWTVGWLKRKRLREFERL